MPSGGKAAAVIGPTGQAGLVSPLDFAALRSGPAGNGWVGVLQPRPHRFVPPLGGSPRWPLGSETPGPQIAADHRQGQPDPGLTRDQRSHRLACPQRKRQTELIGTPPGDQEAQPVLLHRTQRFLLARATAPTPTRQDRLAALRRHFDPLTDKSAVHAYCLGRFNPCLAGPYHRHRDTAQLRLRRRGKLAKISFDLHTVLNSQIR